MCFLEKIGKILDNLTKDLLRIRHYYSSTMVMDTIQVRMSKGLIKKADDLVSTGLYSNRSDVIRDALRKMKLESQIGSIPNTGDSVKEIREIRKKLSKKIKSFKDVEKINKSYD